MAKEADNIAEVDDSGWKIVVEPFPETFPFENMGDTLTGFYASVKDVEQDDLNNPGDKRMVKVYTIDANGKKWGVWGSYNVDLAFEDIAPGTEVRITYNGTVDIDNGRRSVKQFVIQTR